MDSTNNGATGSVMTSSSEQMVTAQSSAKRLQISDYSSDSDSMHDTVTNDRKSSKNKRKKLTNNVLISKQSTVVSSPDVNISQLSKSSKSAAIDEAIERVLSQNCSESKVASDTDATSEIKELRIIINRQNCIIENVVSRLNFVLSMFNIDEVSMSTICASANNDHNTISNGEALSGNQWPVLPSQLATDNHADRSNQAIINTSVQRSYSTVAGRNIQPKETHQQFTKLRQSMVAAVYIDQRDRDNRASSFIISGLPTSAVHSDTSIVKELCTNEFHVDIDIVNTKRLGKVLSSSSSSSLSSSSVKVQPILVNVKNTDHVKQIVSSARQLRVSAVPLIRDNVFINPNLTKAEAAAAYELRCRRRQTAARRSTTNLSNGHAAKNQQPATIPSSLPGSMPVTAAVLNAAVPAFVPNATP